MKAYKIAIFFIYFFLYSFLLKAQNLTGVWEGKMGNDQWLQLNIIQKGNEICGFSYDTVSSQNLNESNNDNNLFSNSNNTEEKNYCKTSFKGVINNANSIIIISNIMLEEGVQSHSKMYMEFKYVFLKNKIKLVGKCYNYNGTIPSKESNYDTLDLIQVSKQKPLMHPAMQACFVKEINKPATQKTKKSYEKESDEKFDTIPQVVIPTTNKNYEREVEKDIKTIITESKVITIDIYDNAEIDGDIISVLLNKKLIIDKEKLSILPIKLTIILSNENKEQVLSLIAHNLGNVPPNTALCIINAGVARYEIFSSVDLNTKANIKFKYVGN